VPDVVATAPIEARPTTKPVVAPAPPPAEPAKPVEEPKADAKPAVDSKVLLPSPTPSQIPPAAPAFDPKDATKSPAKHADATKGIDTAKAEAAKTETPKPNVIPATVFLSVDPWGEVFVNGKSQGVSPPKKFVKLDPGKYKIEVKNTTFPVHAQNLEVKPREEVTLKHRFQ
jgi:hypothetical protein